MAGNPEEDERGARSEARFNEALRRPGYWSILRFVAAGLVILAIVVATFKLISG